MPLVSLFSAAVAGIGLFVAALSWRVSRAPGWHEHRWLAGLVLAASLYSFSSLAIYYLDAPHPLLVAIGHAQLLLATLHLHAWIRYSAAFVGPPLGRGERIALAMLSLICLAAFIPGALVSDRLVHHVFAPLGLTYREAELTSAGQVAMLLVLGTLLLPLKRFVAAWRVGVQGLEAHLVSLVVLLTMGTNDLLVALGLVQMPYLLDFGAVSIAVAMGYLVTERFLDDSKLLQSLRTQHESLVSERIRRLGENHDALLRAEKLVALGQFSAGVAHGINNPAAVVTANLRYLIDSLNETGALPEDQLECLTDSKASMERITTIVRHLLDASRIAAVCCTPTHAVRVADAVAEAFRELRGNGNVHRLETTVPADLYVLAEEHMLAKVLVTLLSNASESIPPERTDGQIRVTGSQSGERIRITIEDNGCGMTKELQRRVFEPFFSTKPVGAGLGLGLAISRGLVSSLQGDLRLESEAGVGTRAIVEFPAAPADSGRETHRYSTSVA